MSDRLEDVIRGCVKQFASTSDFFTFAQSGNGLSLSVQDVTTIIENHRFSVEEQKKKLLWLWVERNGANATPEKIRDLVRQYYVADQRDPAAHVGRIENVFQDVIMQFTSKKFKQFARSGQGLSLTEHEVDSITENNRFSVEERNLKLLFKWRHSRYPNTDDAAVIEKIKMVVGLYIQDANQVEKEQIIQEQDEAENEQLSGSVGSISEISENLKKPTPPETSAKAMANVKSNHEYLGMMANYVKQLFESVKDFSVKPPDPTRVSAVTPTQTTEVSEAKEFLEVVENSMKQMLESRLKPAMEKTKMEYFIPPKVTEFKELESNDQTSLQSVDITEIYSDSSVNHVMLLGDTGSGKTTFSMRYTMLALEKRNEDLVNNTVSCLLEVTS
uniref:uncharacterized protein LOC120348468 n=1 Tax=Styela clava TaxID=7725 RepID=UPI00193A3877|nr:uncharacterized protein LOC120348468 [Styela clava]